MTLGEFAVLLVMSIGMAAIGLFALGPCQPTQCQPVVIVVPAGDVPPAQPLTGHVWGVDVDGDML